MKIPLSYSYKDFLLYSGQDRVRIGNGCHRITKIVIYSPTRFSNREQYGDGYKCVPGICIKC